jgi:hypothetical protein
LILTELTLIKRRRPTTKQRQRTITLVDLDGDDRSDSDRFAEFVATAVFRYNTGVPKRDANQEALRQVELITGSKPVRGETLLPQARSSNSFRRLQLREAASHAQNYASRGRWT